MGEYPYLKSVIRVIGSLTGEDKVLFSKAFEIWEKNKSLDPSQCVQLAQEALFNESMKDYILQIANKYGWDIKTTEYKIEKVREILGSITAQDAIAFLLMAMPPQKPKVALDN